jgi:hypothetical protein
VKKVVAQSTMSQQIGKDMKVRRSWLDFDYPYKPPPTFTRLG